MNRLQTKSGSPRSSRAPAAARLTWLDLFRGVAVLVMIETHVFNTFLAAELRGTAAFGLLTGLNGLVAPSFLFIAGYLSGWERRTAPGKPVNYPRRAWRLLGILMLAYALHIPGPEMSQHRWDDALRVGAQFDVLQCIAVSLGVLLALSWLASKLPRRRGEALWWIGVVATAAFVVTGAPLVQSWTGGVVPFRALVNQTTGSLFPIFPWMGFVLLGALAGAWPVRPIHERLAAMIGLAGVAWMCRGTEFSAVSASFFLERAVWVLGLAAVFEWSARFRRPVLLMFAGKNSLTLYVVHLVLISTLVGVGVPSMALPLPLTLGLLAAVALTSLASAYLRGAAAVWWSAQRARRTEAAREFSPAADA